MHPRLDLPQALTDPSVVSQHMLPADWTVPGLLEAVASMVPLPSALIDTGALVTGMSNLQARGAFVLGWDSM